MSRLSLAALAALPTAVRRPAYDLAATRIGIVHLAPGAFFRAHVAAYVDTLLAHDPAWAISAIALRSGSVRDALTPQDGLYTLATRAAVTAFRVIGSVRELLVAPEQADAVLERLANPDTRLVTLTITEKGYCLAGDGTLDFGHPDIAADLAGRSTSAIGWLVAGLRERRARGLPPFVVMSCDNLGRNGAKLRGAVLALAGAIDAGLAEWIEVTASFPATMVDSITPATDDDLRRLVAAGTGVEDAWPVQREPFTQWVIEAVPGLPDLALAGASIVADVAPYETAKLRLLNGAHSTLAYLGSLRGHATVAEAMTDVPLRDFVEALMRADIAATLPSTPGLDVPAYITDILARFGNPGIAHRLEQIAGDGSQKLPYRIVDTIAELRAADRSVDRPLTTVAAWIAYVSDRARRRLPIADPLADRLAELSSGPVAGFLALPGFRRLEPLAPQIEAALRRLPGL